MEHSGTASPRANVLAIVAFVCAFLVNTAGGILGLVALKQIGRSGEAGRGLAIASVIIVPHSFS